MSVIRTSAPRPVEMLDVRERVRRALEANGFKFVGGGVSMVDPSTDLDVDLGEHAFNVTIRWRYRKTAAAA